jgi:hypothetical protein
LYILDRDDFSINNSSNTDSADENYVGDVESEESVIHRSVHSKATTKNRKILGRNKTSTPAKSSPISLISKQKIQTTPDGKKSSRKKSSSSFSSVSDVFGKFLVIIEFHIFFIFLFFFRNYDVLYIFQIYNGFLVSQQSQHKCLKISVWHQVNIFLNLYFHSLEEKCVGGSYSF